VIHRIHAAATIARSTVVLAIIAINARAAAGIVTVIDDPSLFASLAGSVTPLDFIAPPGGPGPISPGTYAEYGITLSSSVPGFPVFSQASVSFLDGWGIHAQDPLSLAFDFDQSIQAFAFERETYAGQNISASFYQNGTLVGATAFQWPAGPDATHFLGWKTDFGFDRIVLNQYVVDNVYFQTVPGPSAFGLIGIVAALGTRRRRR
jgi:MYXO-CTERM domain-containing protein